MTETDPRPSGCCGVCPGIVGGGYDCTCADNPRCPNTDPVELVRRWDISDLTDVGLLDVLDCALRLADKVEIALPSALAQRDDALREVASICQEIDKALTDTTIRHNGDTARAVAHLAAERDTARLLAASLDDNSAALDRVRELAEHWANPTIKIDGQAPSIRPEYAARVILRALNGEAQG